MPGGISFVGPRCVNSAPLHPKTQAILTECIDSVAQLELLLFLHRNPARAWSFHQLASELRTTPSGVKVQAQLLVQGKLAARNGDGIQYAADPQREEAVRELARSYAQSPVAVIRLIYSKPDRTLQSFADAFRLRPEPPQTPPGEPPHG